MSYSRTWTKKEKRFVYLMTLISSYDKRTILRFAVMYLYYLKSKIKSEVNISLLEISMVFPMGFPSDLESHKLWDLQKVEGNNLLDIVDVSDL